MIASILEYGDLSKEEEQNLVHITSRHVLDDVATKSVKEAKRIKEDQHTTFVKERLINRRTSLYDTLKRNDLSLFRQKKIERKDRKFKLCEALVCKPIFSLPVERRRPRQLLCPLKSCFPSLNIRVW